MSHPCISCDAETDNESAACDKCLNEMRDFIKEMNRDKMCKKCSYKKHSKQISALPSCNDCGKSGNCEYSPGWGKQVRINCPHWARRSNE